MALTASIWFVQAEPAIFTSMPTEHLLSEPYVLGLWADLQRLLDASQNDLAVAERDAQTIWPLVEQAQHEWREHREAKQQNTQSIHATLGSLARCNQEMAAVYREIALFQRKMEQIQQAVANTEDNRQLRRERAKIGIQLEDLEKKIETLKTEAQTLRTTGKNYEKKTIALLDNEHRLNQISNHLQKQLPSPSLYLALCEYSLAYAHCNYFLSQHKMEWIEHITKAGEGLLRLYTLIQQGYYHIHKHSDVLDGRHLIATEMFYALYAAGQEQMAIQLFESMCHDEHALTDIFLVFRTYALGYLLKNEQKKLEILLFRHQYAQGLWGGYVQCFRSMLEKNVKKFEMGINQILMHEFDLYQRKIERRGMGVINVGGLVFMKYARSVGMQCNVHAVTLPLQLISNIDSKQRNIV